MIDIFVCFTISIFCDCDFDEFASAVYQIKSASIESKKVGIFEVLPHVEDYFNPPSGGAHFPKYCFWKSVNYPKKVFLISNFEDGLYTMCNVIHNQIGGNLIMCSLSNENHNANPFFQFRYSSFKFEERVIAVKTLILFTQYRQI